MLIKRIITALCLIPLVLLFVIYASEPWFAGVTLIVSLYAAWEFAGLINLPRVPQIIYMAVIAGLIAICFTHAWNLYVMIIGGVWWCVALLKVVLYPRLSFTCKWLNAFHGLMAIVPSWTALNIIFVGFGPAFLVFLFALVWVADSGAYFAGRAFGKHKLAPKVSPGKSWEGAIGGLIASAIIGGVFLYYFDSVGLMFPWQRILILAAATFVASVVGDLYISTVKRQFDVKDTGSIFPGHGGLLDRIDSLLAAAPIFVLLVTGLF